MGAQKYFTDRGYDKKTNVWKPEQLRHLAHH